MIARRGLFNQFPLAIFDLLISNRSHSIFNWITFYRSLVIFLSEADNDLFSHYLSNLIGSFIAYFMSVIF